MKALGILLTFVAGFVLAYVMLCGRHGGLDEKCNRDGSCNYPALTCWNVATSYYNSSATTDYRCVMRKGELPKP